MAKNKCVGKKDMLKNMIQIGSLRHRITIQEFSTSKDSFGAEVKTWRDFAKVSASIKPLSGKELFNVQQLHAEATVKVVIRYIEGLNTSMRLLFKDMVYDILSISNIEERNISQHLLCKERKEAN